MVNDPHATPAPRADERRSRRGAEPDDTGVRSPTRQEQTLQYFSRYTFALLGLIFFARAPLAPGAWPGLAGIALVLGGYLALNSVNFWHAVHRVESPRRFRFALWLDITVVSICVLADPYAFPPSLIVYSVIVLGTGMRFGPRMFAEALVGSFAAALLVLGTRHVIAAGVLTPAVVLTGVAGMGAMAWAWVMMQAVDAARRDRDRTRRMDPVTGLLNRGGLFEAADRLLGRATESRPVAVLFGDIGEPRSQAGAHPDATLAGVATAVRASLRADDVAAHYGGGGFILLLPYADAPQAERVADRIRQRISDVPQGAAPLCRIHFTVAAAPAHGRSLGAILEHTDRTLQTNAAARLDWVREGTGEPG